MVELTLARLQAYYGINDSAKVDQSEQILELYNGKHKKLAEMLEDQYGENPLDPIKGFQEEEDHHDTNHAFSQSSLGMMLEDIAKRTGDVSSLIDESWKGRGKRKANLKKMQDALEDRLYAAETGVKVASKHSELSVDCCPVSTFDMSGDTSIEDLPLFRKMLDGLVKSPCFKNFVQISLANVGIGAAHVVALAPLLTENSTIKRLNLSGNHITRGILRDSEHMQKPYLHDDYAIDTRGLHILCHVMKHTHVMSHLYLANCYLDFEATRDLIKAIFSNELLLPPHKAVLRKLDLSNNIVGLKVRQKTAARIEEVLNENKLPKRIIYLCDQDEEPEIDEDDMAQEEDYSAGYDEGQAGHEQQGYGYDDQQPAEQIAYGESYDY